MEQDVHSRDMRTWETLVLVFNIPIDNALKFITHSYGVQIMHAKEP